MARKKQTIFPRHTSLDLSHQPHLKATHSHLVATPGDHVLATFLVGYRVPYTIYVCMYIYPPTPLPCLRGRRKGRTKPCPRQHRSCGQPRHAFVHPRHTSHPCRHPIHARFRHVCCHLPGALYYVSFTVSKVPFPQRLEGLRMQRLWLACARKWGGVWPFHIHCRKASFLSLCMPYFPYFRNHAPRCSTGLFHGTGRSIQTSMALPCMPCICLPCVCIALSCLVLVCVLPCPCMYCLVFSGSEDAVSGASLRTLLAPPWASILLGIWCFATMPHRAPQGFSMVLAGPSRQLWLCLLCLLCLAYAFCLAVPKMLFRHPLCARFWHRLGLQSCWGSGVSQPCPTVLHRAFPCMVLAGPSRQLWLCLLCLLCLLFSSSEDAISTASLRTLLAPPWASILLGIRCFATMPHRAPQGFSMVLAGPSRQLWLCLLCLLCLAYAFCFAVPELPNVLFFAVPELGFRWCLAVSDPLARSCIFAIVQARLRHVFGLRTGAKGAVLDPPNSS